MSRKIASDNFDNTTRRVFYLNKALTGLIHGRIANRVGREVITSSLTGAITQTDIDVIRQMRDEVQLAK